MVGCRKKSAPKFQAGYRHSGRLGDGGPFHLVSFMTRNVPVKEHLAQRSLR